MIEATFDPENELAMIRQLRDTQRRRKYRKSKLDRFRAELVAMRQKGASAQDLAVWLRVKHRLKIHRSNVDRYLRGLSANKTVMTSGRRSSPDMPSISERGADAIIP